MSSPQAVAESGRQRQILQAKTRRLFSPATGLLSDSQLYSKLALKEEKERDFF
jgi:hypothetical protein